MTEKSPGRHHRAIGTRTSGIHHIEVILVIFFWNFRHFDGKSIGISLAHVNQLIGTLKQAQHITPKIRDQGLRGQFCFDRPAQFIGPAFDIGDMSQRSIELFTGAPLWKLS